MSLPCCARCVHNGVLLFASAAVSARPTQTCLSFCCHTPHTPGSLLCTTYTSSFHIPHNYLLFSSGTGHTYCTSCRCSRALPSTIPLHQPPPSLPSPLARPDLPRACPAIVLAPSSSSKTDPTTCFGQDVASPSSWAALWPARFCNVSLVSGHHTTRCSASLHSASTSGSL